METPISMFHTRIREVKLASVLVVIGKRLRDFSFVYVQNNYVKQREKVCDADVAMLGFLRILLPHILLGSGAFVQQNQKQGDISCNLKCINIFTSEKSRPLTTTMLFLDMRNKFGFIM